MILLMHDFLPKRFPLISSPPHDDMFFTSYDHPAPIQAFCASPRVVDPEKLHGLSVDFDNFCVFRGDEMVFKKINLNFSSRPYTFILVFTTCAGHCVENVHCVETTNVHDCVVCVVSTQCTTCAGQRAQRGNSTGRLFFDVNFAFYLSTS